MSNLLPQKFFLAVRIGAVAVLALSLLSVPNISVAGNGNGNGNGNGQGNGNGNGHGHEARNLGNNNAARANETAQANAAVNSTPGRLSIYRQMVVTSVESIEKQNVAAQQLVHLQGMTDEEIAMAFPNGGYDAAMQQAMTVYQRTTLQAQAAEAERQASLMVLTDGRDLSEDDLAALHRMLGL